MDLKKKYRLTRTVYDAVRTITFIAFLMGLLFARDRPVMYIPLIIVIGGFLSTIAIAVYSSIRLCCPHCGTPLPLKGSKPNNCSHCGEKLDL